MLSNSSFNALLKTLEEPPEHVKFVFATTDVQKVPTTILSRCQRFDLKRIPAALISEHLLMIAGKEKVALAPAAAETIARGAEGGMRDAESMLDQLVAFCGNTITEEDVLNVFGFTAQQTVTTLCDHLLGGDAPGALALVHAQAEGGKDLMRLLADLIAHLRNLLVAKADPAGLEDELTEEQVAALIAQAEHVAMDRLLDLIEQFAAAEGRMKWAPNKKMHLEVAVIRAIQTLNQATLTDVLDTLTALRGGAPPPAKPAPKPVPAPIIPKAAPPPAEPVHFVHEAPSTIDPASLWATAIRTIRDERHPLRLWASSGTLLAIDGGTAVLGFQSDQSLAAGHCEEPANRQYLEDLLSRLAKQPLKLRCELREQLEVPNIPLAQTPESRPEPVRDPMEDFKNDPLIRRALELFKAEIQPT
jgi:DNA polymerase-3 subunit gamma/tau